MNPCFLELDSKQETYFIEEFLEKSELVEFWFKNGVNSETFFGVPYENELGETKTFYPDFIVYFKNGTIGIFDPKSGFTLTEGKDKAKGLEKFLVENENIVGGLIEVNSLNNEHTTIRMNIKGDYDLTTREDFIILNNTTLSQLITHS